MSATFKGNIFDNDRDGYSMDPLLPKKEGICDNCGHQLVIREDDTEKVISSRMKEYEAKTKPLLEIFEKMGVLINCEAKKGVKDYPELKKLVEQKLAQNWWSYKILILYLFKFIRKTENKGIL